MSSFTDHIRGYDVVKYMADEAFCCDAVAIKNTSGGALLAGAIKPGCLLRNNSGVYETLLNANVSAPAAIVIEPDLIEAVAIAGTTTRKYKVIKHGPARIDFNALPTADLAGTSYTAATLKTALQALNFEFHYEPTLKSTQTT